MVENLKARSSSIALFTIDLLGIPDLSDNVFVFFFTSISHIFGSTVFADFLFKQCDFFPIILHQGVPANFLIHFC